MNEYNSYIVENQKINEKILNKICINEISDYNLYLYNPSNYIPVDIITRYHKMKDSKFSIIKNLSPNNINPVECIHILNDNFCKKSFYNFIKKSFCNLYNNCYVYKESKLAYWNPTKKCLINENDVENKLVYSNEIMKYGKNYINIQIYEIKLEIDNLKKPKKNKKIDIHHTESFIDEMDSNYKKNYITIQTERPEQLYFTTAIKINPNDSKYTIFHNNFFINPLTRKSCKIICDNNIIVNTVELVSLDKFIDFDKENNLINNFYNENINRLNARKNIIEKLKLKDLISIHNGQINIKVQHGTNEIIESFLNTQWIIDFKSIKDKRKDLDFNFSENINDLCITGNNDYKYLIPAYNILSKSVGINDWIIAYDINEVNMIVERDYSSIEDLRIIHDINYFDMIFIDSIYLIYKCKKKEIIEPNFELPYNLKINNIDDLINDEQLDMSRFSELNDSNSINQTETNLLLPINDITKIDICIIDKNNFFNLEKIIYLNLLTINQCLFKKIHFIKNINLLINEKDIFRLTIIDYKKDNLIGTEEKKMFLKKVWNIYKFCNEHLDNFNKNVLIDYTNLELHHKWIINKTMKLGIQISNKIESIEINNCYNLLNEYWNIFSNKYINIIKNNINKNLNTEKTKIILFNILITNLKILYPLIPHFAQYIYSIMRGNDLITRPWPKFNDIQESTEIDIQIDSLLNNVI